MLAGVVAGAVLGVLLAPERGSTIRKKILRRQEDFESTFGDKTGGKFKRVMTVGGEERSKSR